MGARNRNVQLARQHIAGRRAAAHHRSPRGPYPAQSLGPAKTELRHRRAFCRQAHTGGLRSNERLEVDAVEESGLQKLALGNRAHHADDRLMGKHHRPLRHRIDVEGQAEIAEGLQEVIRKQRTAARGLESCQISHVVVRKTIAVNNLGQLLHASGNGKAALKGIVAKIHVKACFFIALTAVSIALGHGHLVQIR